MDTGVEEGDNVTVFYDPMICKLIVHGPDRAAALSKLRSSLREYNIAGLRTNIDFVHSVAAHPEFMSGDYTTTFIEENAEELFEVKAAPASQVAQVRLCATRGRERARVCERREGRGGGGGGFFCIRIFLSGEYGL